VLEVASLALTASSATASRPYRRAGATVAGEVLHVDLAAKGSLQIEDESAQIEDGAFGIEGDEESTSLPGTASPLAPAIRSISVRRWRSSARVMDDLLPDATPAETVDV
jgi:hypothetical protein